MEGLLLAWFGVCAPPNVVPVVEKAEARAYRLGVWFPEWDREQHRRRVASVQRHIAAGQTYQCNVTTRMNSAVEGDLLALYGDLALAQGGADNAFINLERFAIVSASPELFFDVTDDLLRMRPMKGTAPRGGTPGADTETEPAAEYAELLAKAEILPRD